jgi:NDP-sugar pyrophosphorylase family protein
VWETGPLEQLAHEGQLGAYRHRGFWLPMDTLRDKMVLEELWASGKAPWKVWQDPGPLDDGEPIHGGEVRTTAHPRLRTTETLQ